MKPGSNLCLSDLRMPGLCNSGSIASSQSSIDIQHEPENIHWQLHCCPRSKCISCPDQGWYSQNMRQDGDHQDLVFRWKNPIELLRKLYGNRRFRGAFKVYARPIYNKEGKRCITDAASADWWLRLQVMFLPHAKQWKSRLRAQCIADSKLCRIC